MKKSTSNINRTLNIAIVLMILSVLFYYFSIYMMSLSQKISMLDLINSNPILGLDLLSVCGRVFGVLILFKLKQSVDTSNQKNKFVIIVLLALSQLLIQNYLTALVLFYASYQTYPSEGLKQRLNISMKEVMPVIAVFALHIMILVIQVRIHVVAGI